MFLQLIIFLLLIGTGVHMTSAYFPDIRIPNFEFWNPQAKFTESSIFFVGDIMLGRNVERLSEESGASYPFRMLDGIIEKADFAVGNFEGSIPKVHVPTQSFDMRFSIHEKYMKEIATAGFDALSLANNHALDYGNEGYANTRIVCEENQILCSGHPVSLGTSSVLKADIGDTRVGILFLHTLFQYPQNEEIKELLLDLRNDTEFQVAYIHWGNEYEFEHSKREEDFAHFLIDEGIDSVIAHHPHVVQDIELYKEKPIFYSLGNFIFDQYFNDGVKEGLGVNVRLGEDFVTYTLIPFTSKSNRSQPTLMNKEEQAVFFSRFTNILGDHSEISEYPYFTVKKDPV